MTQLEFDFTYLPSGVVAPFEETPLFRQFQHLKRQVQDETILFMRIGDFYETFKHDAQMVSAVCEVAQSMRGGVPMAGVPCHAIDGYIAKLDAAGYAVALAERTEDAADTTPRKRWTVCRRGISRIAKEA